MESPYPYRITPYFGLPRQPNHVWYRLGNNLRDYHDTYTTRVYNLENQGYPQITGEDGVGLAFALESVGAYDSTLIPWPDQTPPYGLLVALGGVRYPSAVEMSELPELGSQVRAQYVCSLLWLQSMLSLALARELLGLTSLNWRGR